MPIYIPYTFVVRVENKIHIVKHCMLITMAFMRVLQSKFSKYSKQGGASPVRRRWIRLWHVLLKLRSRNYVCTCIAIVSQTDYVQSECSEVRPRISDYFTSMLFIKQNL